jgi:hypothetical protein
MECERETKEIIKTYFEFSAARRRTTHEKGTRN